MMVAIAPPYEALAVANRFLALARRDKLGLDHLKLQKLLYCAHGWYLVFTGKPLLQEHAEAWPYGPVIPSVYHEFKRFGSLPIMVSAMRAVPNPLGGAQLACYELQADEYTDRVIESVWQTYKGYSSLQLSTLTHQPDMAWDKVNKRNDGRTGTDIPDLEIWSEFKRRLDDAGTAASAA